MFTLEYPLRLTPDERDGGFVVAFPDFPEVVTQGDSVEEALAQGEDALDEAVANRIAMQLEVPAPSTTPARGYVVAVPANTALKAVFYRAIRELALSKVQLAALLGVDEKEVRRLLDPRHPSKLTRIEELLRRLGKRVVIGLADVAEMPSARGHKRERDPRPLGKVS